MKTWIAALKMFLLVSVMVTAASCGGGGNGNSSDDGGEGTTSAQIGLDFGAISPALLLPPFQNLAQEPPSAILAINIEVLDGVTSLGTFPMTFSGTWGVTINDLPVGVSLTFQAQGYNSATVFNGTTLIYGGTTVQTLADVPESVSISMDPSGITVTFPQITSITIPAQFETDSTAAVSFGLASGSSPLDYAITTGGGSFNTSSGSIAMVAGTATLNSNYTAPSGTGTYNHSILIDNPDDFSVEQGFSTVVVAAVTDVTVTVEFAPALTALLAERFPYNGTDIVWTATAEDDITAPASLAFTWSFTNTGASSASFAVSTTNVATLENYDPATTEGTLTMTITDGDALTTTITYILPIGQFPTY